MKSLLTEAILQIVAEKQNNGFGISIVNLPDIDFDLFLSKLRSTEKTEIFYLGYDEEQNESLRTQAAPYANVSVFFSVEEAERSRNLGQEDIFRIHFIKNTEMEKISSLRWYNEIDMAAVYKKSCRLAQERLTRSNATINELLAALARKDIRTILNFDRVLDYLEALLAAPEAELPHAVSDELYRLGLLSDASFGVGSSTRDQLRDRIKRNHALVLRISSLEQKERQNIANYSSRNPDNTVVRLILDYYRRPSLELLKQMELSEVESCMKAAAATGRPSRPARRAGSNPTVSTAQMIFDGNEKQVDQFLSKATEIIDNRPDSNKSEIKTIEIDDVRIDIPVQVTTERLAEMLKDDTQWGGVIYADVASPKEAVDNAEKYDFEQFDGSFIEQAKEYLRRAASFPEAAVAANAVLNAISAFEETRKLLYPFRKRLQDMPMLQVVSQSSTFSAYLCAYEQLLSVLKEHFKDLYDLDSVGAKDVVSTLLSLDMVYVVGKTNSHAIPTPLNPLYLWKYTKLAEEMLGSRGVPEGGDCYLSEKDKEFIIRKAEDIPDPLALVMLPKNEVSRTECLPYAGRIGAIPVYSTKPQISDSGLGLDAVRQSITRYMCLYPHSSMMLRVSFVNPPSVEDVVRMLKRLDSDREFASFGDVGIDLTIYRTKETSPDWIELEDKSLNEGMLGKIRGKTQRRFSLAIKNKCLSYSEILKAIKQDQHIVVIFDPNEREIDLARNDRSVHLHPLCVPKVYEYNKMRGDVKIRAANEGGIFADYASIIEKLYEQPSTFGHRNVFMNSPLKKETYEALLKKTDWLVILDQNLKSWDVSLQSTGERLFYKSSDFRSIGIYSKNTRKFAIGYQEIIAEAGNYIPTDSGVEGLISATRAINDDGLLSIVSHSTNQIFDQKHGKGSLGLAITAIQYSQERPDAILVGLDTQLAREWLADRDDGRLPDLIGIRLPESDDYPPLIDLIEVKTYQAYSITDEGVISGDAVEQASVLESLILEMFGKSEKITTVSRREILREQVFECLFSNASYGPSKTEHLTKQMNGLFAGEYSVSINRIISHVDFTSSDSAKHDCRDETGKAYQLSIIGSQDIQRIISGQQAEAFPAEREAAAAPAQREAEGRPQEHTAADTDSRPAAHPASGMVDRQITNVPAAAPQAPDIEAQEQEADEELHEKCVRLNVVLKSYGIQALPVDQSLVQQAARFTRFKLELKPGETEANLKKRSEDIARELEAAGEVFIGRINGTRYIGLDVPFSGNNKPLLLLEHLNALDDADGALSILAGQTPDGEFKIIDLAKAPHMLIAGTTGSGKTIFLYSIIVSLLHQYSADDLELLIVDPKQTDFRFFEGLPHLRGGRVLTDAEEAVAALEAINEVDKVERTNLIKSLNSRDIESYNAKCPEKRMKRLVVVIDEYADLVQAAELQGKEVRKTFESNLCMLAQRVRNLGIHLVIATQQPRATIVTSSLKAVLPFRTSFRLPSHTDSQTILDRSGAEDLLGKGDMLMLTDSDLIRMQGFFIPEDELISFIDTRKE